MPMKFLKPLFAALALTLCAQAPVQAFCGFYAGKADANLFNEASQVVVVRDGQRTVLSMLNDYKGPLSEFALVVPTPARAWNVSLLTRSDFAMMWSPSDRGRNRFGTGRHR